MDIVDLLTEMTQITSFGYYAEVRSCLLDKLVISHNFGLSCF